MNIVLFSRLLIVPFDIREVSFFSLSHSFVKQEDIAIALGQVLRPATIVKENNAGRIRSKLANSFCKNNPSRTTIVSRQARRLFKRRGYLRKQNNHNESRRRGKSSRSKESETRGENSTSSESSSDLRNASRNGNRNISSRLVQYTFYSVVNTGVAMDQGTSASALCRSFLALFLKIDESDVYSTFLDSWDKAGQKIIVLKGYNHKHLQYLAKEVRHIAVESNTLYRTTSRAQVMLVLTAFGREEDMEEAFDDLCYLH